MASPYGKRLITRSFNFQTHLSSKFVVLHSRDVKLEV